MSKLICIAGPTAVGKSDIALTLAKKFNKCIVSADSMQIYQGMNIGTAKPSLDEQSQVRHFMIDVVEPDCDYNAYLYSNAVDKILSQNPDAIVVGGTGLYFESLIYGLDFPTSDETQNLRKELWEYYEKNGKDALHKKLADVNPERAAKIHPNNIKSVIRALEIQNKTEFAPKKERIPIRDYVLFGLNCDRTILYERINARVEDMFEKGLVDEVKNLLNRYSPDTQAFQAIGYKETIGYIKRNVNLSETKELIKQHTRNYAKRQITFLKRLNPIWLDVSHGKEYVTQEILKNI